MKIKFKDKRSFNSQYRSLDKNRIHDLFCYSSVSMSSNMWDLHLFHRISHNFSYSHQRALQTGNDDSSVVVRVNEPRYRGYG